MNRTAGQRERTWVAFGAVAAFCTLIRAVVTGHSPVAVVFGVAVWGAVTALAVAQYRLLGHEAYIGSARYHLLLTVLMALCWLPFAVDVLRDAGRDNSASGWDVVFFIVVGYTLTSGWREYRKAARAVTR